MAEINFTNAVLEPYNRCPASFPDIAIETDPYIIRLVDASGNRITSSDNDNFEIVRSAYNDILYHFWGTMGTNGTEIYLRKSYGGAVNWYWKISNVSFQSGDTYDFQINAVLMN